MDIIITAGPSLDNKSQLISCIRNGAGILRLNFSHRDTNFFSDIIKASRCLKKDITIMQDIPGKKIRVDNNFSKPIKVERKDRVVFTGKDSIDYSAYNTKVIPLNISKSEIADNVQSIKSLSLKDGSIRFKIIDINEGKILAEALNEGIIRRGKGCNIKGFKRKNTNLSDEEIKNIDWACNNKINIICQSFVESKEDLNKIIEYIGDKEIEVWAKIETREGINNISEILSVADGIIVGRGDLIPETSLLEVPIFQEEIIQKCKAKNKRLIFATHIFDSMIRGKNLALPEVESVWNYINKGVDGFLLAGETSIGKNPERAVKILTKIDYMYKKSLFANNNK